MNKKLHVFIDPPELTFSSSDSVANLGDTVTLSCSAAGFPLPTMKWYRYSFREERTGKCIKYTAWLIKSSSSSLLQLKKHIVFKIKHAIKKTFCIKIKCTIEKHVVFQIKIEKT